MDSHNVTVSDGATLHYLAGGQGPPVLMLPGAGFSAELFTRQFAELSRDHRVISLDKRGHGRSQPVREGYRVSRLAKDLNDVMEALDLTDVRIVAHSLGAATVYDYVDLFGTDRIDKLVVVDEPSVLLVDPAWSQEERTRYGAIYNAGELHELTGGFAAPDPSELLDGIVQNMTTPTASQADRDFIRSCLQIPGDAAVRLFFNNISQDFRDVLPKLDIPTLFVTGRGSLHPWQSHVWMSQQVPDGSVHVFEEDEGGNHFPFVENPDGFNRVVGQFLRS